MLCRYCCGVKLVEGVVRRWKEIAEFGINDADHGTGIGEFLKWDHYRYRKFVRIAMGQGSNLQSKISSSLDLNNIKSAASTPTLFSDQTCLLLTRRSRHLVSLWTCSKLCAICFVSGVVVGYTLKRRVSRWASKLLRRLKDD